MSADNTGKTGNVSGILHRFERSRRASEHGVALGLIKNVFDDAIEYTAIAPGMRGVVMLGGVLIAAFAFWFGQLFLFDILERGKFRLFEIFAVFCTSLFFIFGAYFGIKYIRFELFRPEDEPTIFDRKNRKVYRIFRETYSGFRGVLSRWPTKTAEYDWDLIDAEHHAAVSTTGSTIARQHGLIFVVRTSATDPTPMDSFAIGNSTLMGEVTVPAAWEHIRRFMEEDGPHLPPGEVLARASSTASFWQCMASAGPYGKRFRIWWREQKAMMVLGLIFFPIVFPLMTLVGIFRWLSYKTAAPIKWSPSVRAAIGAA